MKTNKIILAIAIVSIFASCKSLREEFQPVFTLDYEDPAYKEPVSINANTTIAELAARYETGKPWIINENIIIKGKVSTTDQPGNFYKSFYIQDETGGIEIKMGQNSLYNDYLPGQEIIVDCKDLCLGMYGYKANYGNGMIQIGFQDPSGEYETSYFETPLLIDTHVKKGEIGDLVTPVVLSESQLPGSNATQKTNSAVGKLVTVKDLTYGWTDTKYNEKNEAFVLLYLDSNKNKKDSSNRIFVSGEDTGITTWAMSKTKMTEYLYSGKWDKYNLGNANDYNYGTVADLKGDGTYPGIEKVAASVSQYFSTPNGTCVQVRTSGYCKFSDQEIDPDVLNGTKKITVTGIMALYQGKIQMVVNNISDIQVQ